MEPEQAHGTLRVLKRRGEGGLALALRHAVLHERRRDADRVEPLADLRPLKVQREYVVAAPREDEDRGPRPLVRGRGIDGNRRHRDVARPDDGPAGDQLVLGRRGVVLLAYVAPVARRSARPEADGAGLGAQAGARGKE